MPFDRNILRLMKNAKVRKSFDNNASGDEGVQIFSSD